MIGAEARLALLERLRSSVDVSDSAHQAMDWLGQHLTSGRALLAAAGSDLQRLCGIAARGISSRRLGEFGLDLDERRDPLVAAAWSDRAERFPGGPGQPETPLGTAPFHAVPLRPNQELPPIGLLLIEGDELEISDDMRWFAEVLGGQFESLRLRNAATDSGVDRDLARARRELENNQRRLTQAEAQMRAERTRLDLLVDSVNVPIIVTDPAGVVLMTNEPAGRFFAAREDGSGESQRRVQANVAQFSSFVSGLMLQTRARGTGQQWRKRLVVIEPESGRAVPVEAVAGSMMAGPSELTGVVTVLHDQTEAVERERLYAELREASAQLEAKIREATAELAHQNELLRRQALALEQASVAKSQFLANVSHEFRTPLNAILGYSLMLMGGFYGPLSAEQSRTVQRIDANSKHLATLINDILDIERIEAGRMPVQVTQFPVQDVVGEVIEELQGVITQSTAALTVVLPDSLPRLKTDRQKVKQILVNLLSNALKYTMNGTIEVQAAYHADEGRLALSVRDTGVGIAPEDHTRIFEPFQQGKGVITRAQGGTGLGLAISKRLAQMLGGDIHVASQLGAGSTFTLDFPVRIRARAPHVKSEEPRRQSA